MSLQVWLPMTKDLRQQGLSNVIATPSSGATYSSTGGKLGGCYTIAPTHGITLPASAMTSFTTGCSVAFWVKINSWKSSYDTFFQAGLNSTPWAHYRFGVLRYGSGSTLCFTITNSSGSSSSGSYVTSSLDTGVWYHLTFTYTAGKVSCYRNGILDKEYTTTIVPDFAGITNISIGRGTNGSSYPTDCNLNDFRIYDHCLSPMEVKQISQGLVLHYPLNRNGWGQENLFSWSNNDTSITLNNYQNTGSFTQFNNSLTFDPSTTVGEKYTISFYARSPNGTTSLMVYNSNSNPQYFNFGSSPQLTSSLGTEWEYFTRTITNAQYSGTGTPSTNTNIWKRIEIYAPNKMGVQVKHIKVEKGEKATPWCPNSADALATTMGLNSTTEYDCSGFCNNGTRTGTFAWTSDTPKYTVSTYIPTSGYITHACCLDNSNQEWTCCAWVKLDDTVGSQNLNDFNYSNRIVHAANGTPLLYLNAGDNDYYMYGSQKVNANEWTHIAFVFKNSTELRNVYVNGVLTNNSGPNKTSTPSGIPATVKVGGSNFAGYMSDYREYATALSASDILSLYQNSATIDSNGVIHGQIR